MIGIKIKTNLPMFNERTVITFPNYHFLVRWLMRMENSQHIVKILEIKEITIPRYKTH